MVVSLFKKSTQGSKWEEDPTNKSNIFIPRLYKNFKFLGDFERLPAPFCRSFFCYICTKDSSILFTYSKHFILPVNLETNILHKIFRKELFNLSLFIKKYKVKSFSKNSLDTIFLNLMNCFHASLIIANSVQIVQVN